MALWGGRFEKGVDAFTQEFGASLEDDKAMAQEDIRALARTPRCWPSRVSSPATMPRPSTLAWKKIRGDCERHLRLGR